MEWLIHPASRAGAAMRSDWYIFIGAGIAVGLIVYGCIAWCLIAYRRRTPAQAAQFGGNPRLEILYAAIPLAMVIALFGVTYAIEMPVDRVGDPADRVAVTAFRWSWRFDYSGGVSVNGTPENPPTLYLPIGRTTEIDLGSADVTHSFWIPAFLFKRDAIPGMTNKFDLSPTRLGRFSGRCAQFCGLEHANMTFTVAVVPSDAYQRYLASKGAVAP